MKQDSRMIRPPVEYNLGKVRALIADAFDDEELTLFCYDHFREVTDRFSSGMGKSTKLFHLIEYCNRHESLGLLLEKVKATRPGKYEKYEAFLVPALEQIRAGTHTYEDAFEPVDVEEASRKRILMEPYSIQESVHPLAGSRQAVKRWFLTELDLEEQIFVVTAALFNGLERPDLMEIYDNALGILLTSLSDELAQTRTQPESRAQFLLFKDEARLLKVANLTTAIGERKIEHGLAPVHLIEFHEETQRQQIIHMLRESFQRVVEQLVPYLRQLAAHPKARVRRRAAKAVSELMCELDFVRYKEEILISWALSDDRVTNLCVGLALEAAAQDPRYAENVKTLLEYWATSSDLNLNRTAVASCVHLGPLWPRETLKILETTLKRDQSDLLVLAVFATRRLLQEGHAQLVLEHLSEWVSDRDASPSLRRAAASIFLETVELSHVVGDSGLMDHAVDVFLIGLSDLKLIDFPLIRSSMLGKLKAWAEMSFDDPERRPTIETLFTRLYVRAGAQRDKNRISFFLDRWRRKDERFAQISYGHVYDSGGNKNGN
jgi:hypothetical protein